MPQSARTQSSSFQVLVTVQVLISLTLLFHSASFKFQHESILNSKSILEAQMSSESGPRCIGALPAWAAQPRPPRRADFFSMTTNRPGRDSLLAQHPLQQVHARNQGSHRTAAHPPPARSGRWRGRSRWSAWRLAPPTRPIPPRRRCHDVGCNITKSTISYGYDILS